MTSNDASVLACDPARRCSVYAQQCSVKRRPAPAATDDVHLCDIYIQLGESGMQIIRIRLSKREQDASL